VLLGVSPCAQNHTLETLRNVQCGVMYNYILNKVVRSMDRVQHYNTKNAEDKACIFWMGELILTRNAISDLGLRVKPGSPAFNSSKHYYVQ
jgi:hypothetical protein